MNTTYIAAVIYNNSEDTKLFCESIKNLEQSSSKIKCILIDNSDNQTIKDEINALLKTYDFVEILRPPKNIGYFGAFNYFLRKYKGKINSNVLLCNNDLQFNPLFIKILDASKYPEDVLVICPDVVTLDGFHQNPHAKNRMSFISKLKLDLYFSSFTVAKSLIFVKKILEKSFGLRKLSNKQDSCYIHMGIGACYVLLPKFFDTFEHLEYPHFLYGEEAYFSNQVHSIGGKLYYDSSLEVLHKESATLSQLPSAKTYHFAQEGYWHYRKFL